MKHATPLLQAVVTLSRVPSSVDEFAAHLKYIESCERRKHELDRLFDDTVAHYDICNEFEIAVDEVEAAKVATLEQDYQRLQDALWAAESMRERYTNSFRGDLCKQVCQSAS